VWEGVWRVRWLATAVAVVLVVGLVGVEPVAGAPRVVSQQASEPGAPLLSLPEVEPEVPTFVPEPEAVVPVGGELGVVPKEVRPKIDGEDDLPEPSHEVVEKRSAVGEVWANTDGSETVRLHQEPINFQPAGSTAWERIDNRLVPDPTRPGWVRNAANSWTVWFGPISPGGAGGVEFVTGAGTAQIAPELDAADVEVLPVVGSGDNADQVTYPEVWPGVDIVYTVSGGRVKEDILVSDNGRADYPFIAEGLGLSTDPSLTADAAPAVTGPIAGTLELAPLIVFDGGGDGAPDAAAEATVEPVDGALTGPDDASVDGSLLPGAAAQRMVVTVDSSWLASESHDNQPVTIDPGFNLPGTVRSFQYQTGTHIETEFQPQIVAAGNYGLNQNGDNLFRSVAGFPYYDYIVGKQIVSANVQLESRTPDYATGGPKYVRLDYASGYSFDGAQGVPNGLIDEQVVGDTASFDVTDQVFWWGFLHKSDGLFGISGEEVTDEFTFMTWNTALLILNLNTPPPAPSVIGPQNNSLSIVDQSPTLSWNGVTDGDGQAVKYVVKVATGTDGESGLVATSPELTTGSWTVPDGVLQDGVTYYWKVFATDGQAWTPSEIRKISVDRRLGAGAMSPSDSFGGAAVNLVTGNLSVAVAAPDMPSVGGGVGVDFVYHAQRTPRGLVGTYRDDVDKDRVIESTDPVKIVRTDPRVSFSWTTIVPGPNGPIGQSGSPTPALTTGEWFSARWSGWVTPPAGNWQFGVRSDDGVRLKLAGSTVVDQWVDRSATTDWDSTTRTGGTPLPISIDYYQATGGSQIELLAREAGTSNEIVVPGTWLSPDTKELPKGWSLQAADMNVSYVRAQVSEGSVTLTGPDGTTYPFSKTPNGGYSPPEGIDDTVIVNGDGKVTVHDDAGYTYVFRSDGGLDGITTAADDRKPAAATNTFDNLGRVSSLTDPVSDRTVTLVYADQDNDPDCPNNPDDVPLASGFQSVNGMLCKVANWDGTDTRLYYKNGLLGYIRNPGGAYWGFSYDTTGRLIGYHDPTVGDAAFTGARTDWARLLNQVAYDGKRVASVSLPPALQTDPDNARPQHSYTYAPVIGADGMLGAGSTATVSRLTAPGTSQTYRSVGYDYRGRTVTDTNAAGLTTTSYWDVNDLPVATETPDGLMTSTVYNNHKQPIEAWGPAPKAKFDLATGQVWGVYRPFANEQANVPEATTTYDGNLDGLAATWWNNTGYDGPPVAHQHNPGTIDEHPVPLPTSVNADGTSLRLTGDITLPDAGITKLGVCTGIDDIATFSIDHDKRGEVWAIGQQKCSPDNVFNSVVTFFPGEKHPIQIDLVDLANTSDLWLMWARPTGPDAWAPWEVVPAAYLAPGYGLVTATKDPEGKITQTDYTDTAAGLGPQHGLPVHTTVDPGDATHLNLTDVNGYEPLDNGYLRQTSHQLPGGGDTTTTKTYYKGKTQTGQTEAEKADNPCGPEPPNPADDNYNQGGMVKTDTSADPDGPGLPQTAIVRSFVYDESGRTIATKIGSDPWTCTTYDSRGRTKTIDYPAWGGQPARTVTNNYAADPDGAGPRPASPLVSSVSDATGTITTEVDLLGRVIAYKDVFGNTTTFGYDLAGRETTNTGPVGTITKIYDNADRLTSLSRNSQVLAEGFVYDPTSGRLTHLSYPAGTGRAGNGTTGDFTYSTDRGQLASITWKAPGGAVITSDQITTRNKTGDITAQTIDGGTHSYTYDNAGRLTQATQPGRTTLYGFGTPSCGYTGAGKNTNRTSQTVNGGTPTTYCYDRADRLTSTTETGVGTITYDTHGNTAQIFGESRTYDIADRHLTTTKPGTPSSTTVTYVRDATDRIVARKVGTATVARYGTTGSGDAPDFTTNTSNVVQEVTYSLPGGVLLTTRTGGNVWSYPNTHGDISAIADQSGAKLGATRLYDPYGNNIAGGIPDNSIGNLDYGWLGQHQRPLEQEPTLQPTIEMGARQYSPLLGRFLETDPIEGGSANNYDYTNGDPINSLDLAGTCSTHHGGIWGHVRSWRCSGSRRVRHAWSRHVQHWGSRAGRFVGRNVAGCVTHVVQCADNLKLAMGPILVAGLFGVVAGLGFAVCGFSFGAGCVLGAAVAGGGLFAFGKVGSSLWWGRNAYKHYEHW
jgi:RHS repeat-associated protein